ncbi:MAG: GGDEF domain-containing protein, partial [Fibromonadales bacterium]|nr:GGDEF domain-containing protein [Fibromonadales bacterium]
SLRLDLLKQNKELLLTANKLEDERNHYFDKSTIDELTQLKNRRDFLDTFKRYLSNYRQTDNFLCIAIMDIDFFKEYNDHYGHLAGDECLKKLGDVLKTLQQDMKVYSARVGGEEFSLLWFEEKANNAEKNALQIKQKIDDLKMPHEKSEVSSNITVSIGIHITECGASNDINELYNMADRALYNAKNNGRNQIVIDA